jgi:hypothetical protein
MCNSGLELGWMSRALTSPSEARGGAHRVVLCLQTGSVPVLITCLTLIELVPETLFVPRMSRLGPNLRRSVPRKTQPL